MFYGYKLLHRPAQFWIILRDGGLFQQYIVKHIADWSSTVRYIFVNTSKIL